VIPRPHVDWFALAPELMLLGAMGFALMGAVLLPRENRRDFGALAAALGFAGAFVYAIVIYVHTPEVQSVIADSVRRDRLGALAQVIIAGAGLLTVGVAYADRMRDEHIAEFYALLAAAGAGMCFLVTANNLMTLFLGLEWFSISLYILCAIDRERESSLEAGLKYLIIGSFGSAVLLFGSALVYGATGELAFNRISDAIGAQHLTGDALLVAGLAMIIVGLGFKASAAPFHMWTPDVYEGAPTPVTGFMAAATKTAALVLTLRVLREAFPQEAHLWTIAIAAIACASLAVGNLAALVQRSLKRMLAYSSIAQAGFMLIPIASDNAIGGRALLYYLIPYSVMSVGAFAVITARERELAAPVTLDNLAGMGWERPLLGVAMCTFMFGFAGLPPTGGFVGKFYAFSAAFRHGWTWLVIVGVVATAVSLYYYLAVVRAMYMRPTAELQLAPTPVPAGAIAAGGSPPRDAMLQATVLLAMAGTIASFIAVQPLIHVAKQAASALPF
jgi:NADH-quinone oxidoreductase subunit N